MPVPLLRPVARPLLLVGGLVAVTVAFADRDPVPFPYLLAVIVAACLAGVVVVRRSVVRTVADRERQIRVESEDRLEEYARINAELSRELLESRVIDEAHQLQGKAFDAFLQGVTITDPNVPGNPIVYANDGFTRLTGYDRSEAVGRSCRFLQGKDTSPEAAGRIREAIREARPCFVEILNYRKDGTPFWNALSIAPILEDGRLTHFVGVQTDITAFKQMELQLRQSQKMEAIGHLAGGVAHDFNNLLTVINGCCELLRANGRLPEDASPLVDEIYRAGDRAATLTRQLLAFGRKTVLQTRVLSLNELVEEFQQILGRLIGEDVQFATEFRADPGLVRVDPGQMEQVLMNLVVNARDAMPQGGRLTIATRDVFLDDDYARGRGDLRPGPYVLLAVTDTGCGMDRATLARMFEPFFTTKPVGKGTGLGLAMVYGILKASGGHVAVESEPGRGTSFHLFLPAVAQPEPTALSPSRIVQPGGTETVLLVEDEAGVRRLARQALESRGYRVLEAPDGESALRLCRQYSAEIDLLLSDVVMPRMSGRELREQVAELCPQTRVLFTSGYTDDAVVRHGVYQSESDFLQKPFSVHGLLRKVREVLDRGLQQPQELLCSGPEQACVTSPATNKPKLCTSS
jgi:two-component system, cell cycle sensor histidine kinase and response regulator CckA